VRVLPLRNLNWGVDEIQLLLESLPHFKELEELSLDGNTKFGDKGCEMLLAGLAAEAPPKLKTVHLRNCRHASPADGTLLAAMHALESGKVPTKVDFGVWEIE